MAAAERLARLAAAREGDHALAPAADPQRWWGVRELSDPGTAMYPDDRPLRLSGSSLARMQDCALRWFFEHEAKAESARTTALGFGSIVHALAAEVATGRLEADPDVIAGHLSRVWRALAFEARWQSPHQYAEAQDCVRRFLAWHAANPRNLLAAEHAFELEVPVGDRRVVLRGSFDRVEVDDGGRVVVVDLKTGAKAVSGADLARHVQLGVYQLAVRSGAVEGLLAARPDEPPPDTAAELVQLRIDDAGAPEGPAAGGAGHRCRAGVGRGDPRRGRRCDVRRAVRRDPRRLVRLLRLHRLLPGCGPRPPGDRMNATHPGPAAPLRDPADLRRLYEAPRDGWQPFTLTDEQLAAATAPLAPGVIVAGAGSGKTTVMQARVVWLAGSGQVRPDQVLGLTFTNKAAGELAQRMRAAFGGATEAMSVLASRRSRRTTPTPGGCCATTDCASESSRPRGCSPTPPATSWPGGCCAGPKARSPSSRPRSAT